MKKKTRNSLFKLFTDGLVDFVFPRVCMVCGQYNIETGGVCDFCLEEEFEFIDQSELQEMILPEGIHHLFSLVYFRKHSAIQEVLHQLKYGDRPDLGQQFGNIMGQVFTPLFDDHSRVILCPVPLSKCRKLSRGYNQAYHLALGMQESRGWEIAGENILVRKKHTKTQTRESIIDRQKNLRNVFEAKTELDSKAHYLIVDDVFTTGATTFSLADAMRQAGAQHISIATLALA